MYSTLIRFSAGGDPLSWLIRSRLGCRFNHCDFLMPDGRLLGSLPDGGVQIRSAPLPHEIEYAVFSVPIQNGWEYLLTQVGSGYDYRAVLALGLPFPRKWRDDTRWFCAEGVAASLERSGLTVVNEDAWCVTPRDLLISPLLTRC